MDNPLSAGPVPLRFGCPVQFKDRRQGTVAGVEVDDHWEVLNLFLTRGIRWWKSSVKLAFSSSPRWSYDSVVLDCTSRQAFARDIPPVAAPARQLSRNTPLSLPGARLLGLLVEPARRHASDVLVRRGGQKYSVDVAAVSFDGKVLHIGAPQQDLRLYLTDEELLESARQAIASNRHIASDERSALSINASNGVATVSGNVRTKQMKDQIAAALAELPAGEVRMEVVDDIDLELAIGCALERAGFQHRAAIYPRSALGDVTLFGRALSAAIVDEIARVVTQVPGTRHVASHMLIDQAPASAQGLRSQTI
jgi:osmotically-inducible protein OsmY